MHKLTYGAVDVLSKRIYNLCKPSWTYCYVMLKLIGHLGLMNDSDTISENITHLVGDGSTANTKTVVVGRGEQKQNFTTEIRHWGKNSEGFILKHGVMKECCSINF